MIDNEMIYEFFRSLFMVIIAILTLLSILSVPYFIYKGFVSVVAGDGIQAAISFISALVIYALCKTIGKLLGGVND